MGFNSEFKGLICSPLHKVFLHQGIYHVKNYLKRGHHLSILRRHTESTSSSFLFLSTFLFIYFAARFHRRAGPVHNTCITTVSSDFSLCTVLKCYLHFRETLHLQFHFLVQYRNSTFLWNCGEYLPDYTASCLRNQHLYIPRCGNLKPASQIILLSNNSLNNIM